MHLVGAEAEALGRGFDDPAVRLVRDEQIELRRIEAVALEQPARDLLGVLHRELEDRRPFLLDVVQALVDGLVRRRQRLPPAGMHSAGPPLPSIIVREVDDVRLVRRSPRDRTTAPAPSPNSTQVVRSV